MKLKHIIIAVMATLVGVRQHPRNEKNDTREPQIFPDYCG